jgi:hypothetical protein
MTDENNFLFNPEIQTDEIYNLAAWVMWLFFWNTLNIPVMLMVGNYGIFDGVRLLGERYTYLPGF